MRTVLVNHLLEPPGRVTGITRFLFALLGALLNVTEDSFVLATCWAEADLPIALIHPRLSVLTQSFRKSAALNLLRQNLILPRLMRDSGATLEFNANPIGGWTGAWPRIVTAHDLYFETMPQAYPWRHRLVWKEAFARVSRDAAAIVAPSASTRDDLLRYYPQCAGRISVIPEAPAFADHAPTVAAPLAGRYGLIVGNLSPNKNAAAIVDALALLAPRLTIPMLHIGRDETGVLAQAQARHPLPVPIQSIQGVSDAALRAAYVNAAFFINTSLHEGFCLPVVEAQALGTPVIASNRSALPEVAGDGALLVDPESPPDIAAAIVAIWTDAGLAASLGARGRLNAQRYSWPKSAARLAELFDRIAPVAPISVSDAIQSPAAHTLART